MSKPTPEASSQTARALPNASALPLEPHLPDPLRMLDGSKITSARDWVERRRPELIRLFEHYMYGRAPAAAAVEFHPAAEGAAHGGASRWKSIELRLATSGSIPSMRLLLIAPSGRSPLGTFLGLNFAGNHTLLREDELPEATCHELGAHARAPRGSAAQTWDVERVIARGYAIATIHTCDVKPDRARRQEGVPRYFASDLSSPDPHAWGALRVWAWGLSRAVDYLVIDPHVGSHPIAVVGHSRLGKAALVAAAFDERIALAIALQAGCGGSAPSRSEVGESVRQINEGFPHWFCDEFKKFNAEPARLPFDQHCLAALVAPRPLLFANATEDSWANPLGQFEVLRAAQPVYELLGVAGLESHSLPAVGHLSAGELGYFMRPGTHSMTPADWAAFLDFADRHLVR